MNDHGAPLYPGNAHGTVRWFVGDRPLHGGEIVQVCCSGAWLTGRFECDSGTRDEPTFFFSLELEGGVQEQQKLVLPEGALIRRA